MAKVQLGQTLSERETADIAAFLESLTGKLRTTLPGPWCCPHQDLTNKQRPGCCAASEIEAPSTAGRRVESGRGRPSGRRLQTGATHDIGRVSRPYAGG